MKTEEIMQLARDAGFLSGVRHQPNGDGGMPFVTCVAAYTFLPELERFAELVAAKEREACVKVARETPWSNWFQSDCVAAIQERGDA